MFDAEFIDAVARLGPYFYIVLVVGAIAYIWARRSAASQRAKEKELSEDKKVERAVKKAHEEMLVKTRAELDDFRMEIIKEYREREESTNKRFEEMQRNFAVCTEKLDTAEDDLLVAIHRRDIAEKERDAAIEKANGLEQRVNDLERIAKELQSELAELVKERDEQNKVLDGLREDNQRLVRQLTSKGHDAIEKNDNADSE